MTTITAVPSGPASDTLPRKLEPVRQALLSDAVAEADRIVSTAVESATDLVAAATAQADAEVDRARHRLELSSQARADQVFARVRTDGHRVVLATQQQLGQQLIDTVHASVQELRTDPRYPALLDHLEAVARSQLGDHAIIERDPQPDGGIVAQAGSRRVDYRLAALADRALDSLADDVAQLWN
jgi:vacuolar-type H+-ATPase subunit E/Vma4